jgi:hypothetical protein
LFGGQSIGETQSKLTERKPNMAAADGAMDTFAPGRMRRQHPRTNQKRSTTVG